MRRSFAFAVAMLAARPASAATYGDALLAMLAARHHDIAAVRIDAMSPNGPVGAAWGDPGTLRAAGPLADAMRRPIGTVAFGHRPGLRPTPDALLAAELGRRIYVAASLMEPDPYARSAERLPRAQALVERAIDANPDLVTLAMHVVPPGRTVNVIIASSFGRIGKPADADDVRVAKDGAVVTETTDHGTRFAVELPMLDAAGRRIGALSTSFIVPPGVDPSSLEPRAEAVRDTLARAIADVGALARFDPLRPRQHGVRLKR